MTVSALLASRPLTPAGRPALSRTTHFDLAGDPLPERAIARFGTLRFRHGAAVHQIAFSPNGKTIVSASPEEQCVRVWHAETGQQRMEIATRAAWCLAISPDGKRIATGEGDGVIRIWDLETAREVLSLGTPVEDDSGVFRLRGESNPVHRIGFVSNQRVVGFHGGDRSVQVWDLLQRRVVARISGEEDSPLMTFAVSGDGQKIATGSAKGEIGIWDSDNGKLVRKLTGHTEQITAVALSRDGNLAVSSSIDQTIRGWDTAAGKEQWQYSAAGFAVAISIAPNGKLFGVAEVAEGGSIQVRSLRDGNAIRTLAMPFRGVVTLSFSPDSSQLATAGSGNAVRLWSVSDGDEIRPMKGHPGPIATVSVSQDGRWVATCSASDTVVRLWEAATGRQIRVFEDHPAGVDEVQLSPDGKLLAAGSWDHPILLWDTATGRCVHSLANHPSVGPHFRFSSDGKTLATAGRSGSVGIWDVGSGKLVSEHTAPPNEVASVLSYSGGRVLAIETPEMDEEGEVSTIPLWDATASRVIRRFKGHRGMVNGAVLSPDGRSMASRGDDQTVRIWEVATGLERRSFRDPSPSSSWTGTQFLAFTADGRTLATCGSHDARVRMWDLAAGVELSGVEGHRGWIGALDFAPNSRQLLTGSQDTTALLWDVSDRLATPIARTHSASDLNRLWEDVKLPDSAAAYPAIWALIDGGDAATAFLRERLKPESATERAQIGRWIEQLDHPQFVVRERATAALSRVVDQAEGELRKAMARPSPEMRERIRRILDGLPEAVRHSERLRTIRAIEVLEGQGTPAARAVLAELSRGAAGAWLTREAQESLVRVERRIVENR
jgi:WD40 repeat protein